MEIRTLVAALGPRHILCTTDVMTSHSASTHCDQQSFLLRTHIGELQQTLSKCPTGAEPAGIFSQDPAAYPTLRVPLSTRIMPERCADSMHRCPDSLGRSLFVYQTAKAIDRAGEARTSAARTPTPALIQIRVPRPQFAVSSNGGAAVRGAWPTESIERLIVSPKKSRYGGRPRWREAPTSKLPGASREGDHGDLT
jgi:hypothetical protein